MNSGARGTETGEGEDGGKRGADEGDDGGRIDVIGDTEDEDADIDDEDVEIDDTGGGDVDIDAETVVGEVGGADVIDNGGRVDVIGDTEDEDVEVDDEMDDETSTRGWDGNNWTGSVDASDSERETAGMRGGPD